MDHIHLFVLLKGKNAPSLGGQTHGEHLVVYVIDDKSIQIVRILHSHMDVYTTDRKLNSTCKKPCHERSLTITDTGKRY